MVSCAGRERGVRSARFTYIRELSFRMKRTQYRIQPQTRKALVRRLALRAFRTVIAGLV